MSTSLAVQPAYRSIVTERSKAHPNRTIFGTTLDNYSKCWTLLNDNSALLEANELYKKKLKWKPRGPTPQRIVDKAWGLRDYKQPEIAEEIVRGYNNLFQEANSEISDKPATATDRNNYASRDSNLRKSKPASTEAPSRPCESVCSNRSNELFERNKSLVISTRNSRRNGPLKQRPMSEPVRGRRPAGGEIKVRVPKFRLPPGAHNFLRTSSMKITETGAKDLINAEPVNKIGLGDTLQYNYQEFQRMETPKFYRDNGHVLLLGQKFTDKTTNKEDSAPGGFYKSNPPDRFINERFRYVQDRRNEITMAHRKEQARRNQFKVQRKAPTGQDESDKYEIPLNILHKYGEENVSRIVKENEDEFLEVVQKPTDLKHSALVPARLNVKELNHPIDPPLQYFTNFGENLKYDKFEGGLHLYIK